MKKTQKNDNIGMTYKERLKEFCKGDDKDKKIEYATDRNESIWEKVQKTARKHNTLLQPTGECSSFQNAAVGCCCKAA